MHKVKDGSRVLQFEGSLLAESSSWRPGAVRWVEFQLYRTAGDSYVLHRIGVSRVHHALGCSLTKRSRLQAVPFGTLTDESSPCDTCRPHGLEEVYPESARYWSQVSSSPEGVLEALYKQDEHGNRYLTRVAQRLLEDSSGADEGMSAVYRTETIA